MRLDLYPDNQVLRFGYSFKNLLDYFLDTRAFEGEPEDLIGQHVTFAEEGPNDSRGELVGIGYWVNSSGNEWPNLIIQNLITGTDSHYRRVEREGTYFAERID